MPQISMVFGEVRSGGIASYVRQRISLLHHGSAAQQDGVRPSLHAETLNKYVAELSSMVGTTSPPLAASVDLTQLPYRKAEIIRRRRDCMIDEVSRLFPLVDGELVEEDIASYLESDWVGFPVGAVVLKRLTNMAVTYYVYPNIRADATNGELVEHELVQAHSELLALRAEEMPNFGAVAKTLAEGLAGLAPAPFNVLGAALISAFWPSANDAATQWKQIYEDLQKIVKNALAEDNVSQASAKIQGFVLFLDNEYKALKDTPNVSKKSLLDALTPYDTAFFLDIVNVFMYTHTTDSGVTSASLANFMTGACLHLALNQERALVDPTASKASDSAYAKSVSNLAATYASYARQMAPNVKDLRLKQIGQVQSSSNTHCGSGSSASCTTSYYFWFTDSNNNYRSANYSYHSAQKNPPNSEGDAKAARDKYYSDVSTSMDATLQSQVYDVANSWDKLVGNPVPDQ